MKAKNQQVIEQIQNARWSDFYDSNQEQQSDLIGADGISHPPKDGTIYRQLIVRSKPDFDQIKRLLEGFLKKTLTQQDRTKLQDLIKAAGIQTWKGVMRAGVLNQSPGTDIDKVMVTKFTGGQKRLPPVLQNAAKFDFTETLEQLGYGRPQNAFKQRSYKLPNGQNVTLKLPYHIAAPDQKIYQKTRDQLTKALNANVFKIKGDMRSLASLYDQQRTSLKRQEQKQKYFDSLKKTLKDKDAQNFKDLQQLGQADWDDVSKVWKIRNEKLEKKFNRAVNDSAFKKRLNDSYALMNVTLSPQQYKEEVPKLVNMIVLANKHFSNVGIGPISSRSLSLYAGRWVDKVTGRIRVLPKATAKYLNPLSYQAKLSYLEARVINKWNQYVDAQAQYLRFASVSQSNWHARMNKNFDKKLQIPDQAYKRAVDWMKAQWAAYLAYLPVSRSSSLVFGALQQQKLTQEWSKYMLSDSDKSNYQDITQWLKKPATQAVTGTSTKEQDIKKRLQYANAFATYMQKAQVKIGNVYKTLLKAMLPAKVDEEFLMKYKKALDVGASQYSKLGGKLKMSESNVNTLKDGEGVKKELLDDFIKDLAIQGGENNFAFKYQLPKKEKAISKVVSYSKPGRLKLVL